MTYRTFVKKFRKSYNAPVSAAFLKAQYEMLMSGIRDVRIHDTALVVFCCTAK
ncbi:MAG: hypothetical protein LBK99_16535 [Opitutaceae bacterium]|nr:hypothetical protein [Opitutaceae bacterium]